MFSSFYNGVLQVIWSGHMCKDSENDITPCTDVWLMWIKLNRKVEKELYTVFSTNYVKGWSISWLISRSVFKLNNQCEMALLNINWQLTQLWQWLLTIPCWRRIQGVKGRLSYDMTEEHRKNNMRWVVIMSTEVSTNMISGADHPQGEGKLTLMLCTVWFTMLISKDLNQYSYLILYSSDTHTHSSPSSMKTSLAIMCSVTAVIARSESIQMNVCKWETLISTVLSTKSSQINCWWVQLFNNFFKIIMLTHLQSFMLASTTDTA